MRYFVYIDMGNEKRACPYFDTLEEAMELYNKNKVTSFKDSLFLGIASDVVTMNSGYCFDVLHRFFDDEVLINDYLHYTEPEIEYAVKEIINKYNVHYQFVSHILNGVLIDYDSCFPRELVNMKLDEKWNEVYLSTLKKDKMENVGWRKNTNRTFDTYAWNWPKKCSYVKLMNVTAYDEQGYEHQIDVDPRDYLLALGKKVSVPERNDDSEND